MFSRGKSRDIGVTNLVTYKNYVSLIFLHEFQQQSPDQVKELKRRGCLNSLSDFISIRSFEITFHFDVRRSSVIRRGVTLLWLIVTSLRKMSSECTNQHFPTFTRNNNSHNTHQRNYGYTITTCTIIYGVYRIIVKLRGG